MIIVFKSRKKESPNSIPQESNSTIQVMDISDELLEKFDFKAMKEERINAKKIYLDDMIKDIHKRIKDRNRLGYDYLLYDINISDNYGEIISKLKEFLKKESITLTGYQTPLFPGQNKVIVKISWE